MRRRNKNNMRTTRIANATRAHHSRNRRRAKSVGHLATPPAPAVSAPGLALATGARVLDLVTATEGKVLDACADHLCDAAGGAKRVESFSVQLADGSTVQRSKKQLAVLPPCLVSALCFPHPAES